MENGNRVKGGEDQFPPAKKKVDRGVNFFIRDLNDGTRSKLVWGGGSTGMIRIRGGKIASEKQSNA